MIKQDKLRFGTAGIPLSTPNRTTIDGIKHVRDLGLESMELEFVRSVNIREPKTPEVKAAAKASDVMLTSHGQYFINLNSLEKEKQVASQGRIFNAAKIASMCGAYSMTFHAAFYQKVDPVKTFNNVLANLKPVIKQLGDEGYEIWVRPETTGKATQWGTLREILDLSANFETVLPCIDFSHIHARTIGKENTYDEFSRSLSMVEDEFGKLGLNNMHIHVAGINYGDKGEKNHLNLEESDMNYKELMQAFKDFKIKGCITCESPNIESDSLLMKKYYDEL